MVILASVEGQRVMCQQSPKAVKGSIVGRHRTMGREEVAVSRANTHPYGGYTVKACSVLPCLAGRSQGP